MYSLFDRGYRFLFPRGLRRRPAEIVGSKPSEGIDVCCDYCVLWVRDLCHELITRPEESYRMSCVVVCDLETSKLKRTWPALDCTSTRNKIIQNAVHIYYKGSLLIIGKRLSCVRITKHALVVWAKCRINGVTSGSRVQLKCDGTRWCTGGEVKGKLANVMGNQCPSHYLGTCCIQHYYRWCRTTLLPAVDWTDVHRPI